MIKGSLLLSAPIVEHQVPFWAKIWRFWGINRGLELNLSFISPKRHILQQVWPVRESEKKRHKKFRYISPICPEAPRVCICTKFGIGGRLVDIINCAEFFYRSLQGYWFCGGLKFALPHRNWRSPLTLSELPFRLWCVPTKFGSLIDFDLLKATSTQMKPEVVLSGRGHYL